jgi:hypothetical protein
MWFATLNVLFSPSRAEGFLNMSDTMKALIKKKRNARRVSPKNKTADVKVSGPVILHRRSPSEFSCGVDLERALLVEESLDERERRG